MLTGELPLGHFASPSRRVGSDPALDAVVLRAMAKDTQHRYQSVRDVRAGMAAATVVGDSVITTTHRAAGQTIASELFLSIGSVLTGLTGCYFLVLASVAFYVLSQV